jgi:hypothetical protein
MTRWTLVTRRVTVGFFAQRPAVQDRPFFSHKDIVSNPNVSHLDGSLEPLWQCRNLQIGLPSVLKGISLQNSL